MYSWTFLIAALGLFSSSYGHSWVEELRRVALNGTMVGAPGYIRGAVSRLDPAFNDFQMQHMLPLADGSDTMCKETQRFENYSVELPALRAQPGDFIALRYQENGHVTLPENDPQKPNSGKVYIYGTSLPFEDESFAHIHHVWNSYGTGGDGRGKLLAERDFDDQRCYQINDGYISLERQHDFSKPPEDPQGADLWCQNDLQLPSDVEGIFTLYWVWDWPTSPTDELPSGQEQRYTSCMDIYIDPDVARGEGTLGYGWESQYLDGQNLNWAAIQEQMVLSA